MPRREYQPNCKRQRSLSNKLKHRHTRNRDQVFSHGRRDYYSVTDCRGSGVSVPLPKNAAKLEGRKQHDQLDEELQRFENKANSQIKEMNQVGEVREEIEKLKRQVQKLNYEVSQQRRSLRKTKEEQQRTIEKSKEAALKGDVALYQALMEIAKLQRTNIDSIQRRIDAMLREIDVILREIRQMKREIEIKEIREASERQRKLIQRKIDAILREIGQLKREIEIKEIRETSERQRKLKNKKEL